MRTSVVVEAHSTSCPKRFVIYVLLCVMLPMTSASQSQSPNFIVLLANDLQSKQRSPFDAFVYVNRIPMAPESDETQEDLAGRILGRLANQEGRVLVKLPRDKLNFKMNCAYCHQIGTVGFRTPEEPVDWETMLRRMDGFGGLYPHTQKTIIGRLMNTYKDDAVDKWPTFVPPPAPTGMAAVATICRNIDTDVWDSYGASSFG